MEIILLEKLHRLGTIGDVVKVKAGYARNFLLPRNKAVRATKANLDMIQLKKADLEAKNQEAKGHAEQIAEKIKGVSINLVRQAGDDGRLYGSVSVREIADAILQKTNEKISGEMVILPGKIKEIGKYTVDIQLHPDVSVAINVNIARGEEEFILNENKETETEQ